MAAAPDAHLPVLKAHVRAEARDRPGVYRMLGHDGEILYVGKSKQLRTRLLSYFRCVYPTTRARASCATRRTWSGTTRRASSPRCCSSCG
jgi:excinuclease ABC subunit C